jgi:peptidoglycan/LPS O-acetylase OafA/YrhL
MAEATVDDPAPTDEERAAGATGVDAAPTRVDNDPAGAGEPQVNVLAGLAAVVAVLGLVSVETTANRGPLGLLLAQSDVAIGLGFVLVGFLVHRPFARALGRGTALPSLRRHGRRWALRIVPAYWVVVVVTHLFAPMASDVRPTTGFSPVASGLTDVPLALLVRAVTFTSPYAPGATVRPDAWLWPVAAVAAFCLVVPVLVTLAARSLTTSNRVGKRPPQRPDPHPLRPQLAVVAAVALAGAAFRLVALAVDPADPRYLTWLPAHLGFFAVGMALAVVVADRDAERPGLDRSGLVRWASRPGAMVVGVAVAVAVLAVVAYGLDLPRTTPWVGGGRGMLRHLAHLVAAAAVCTPVLVGAARRRTAAGAGTGDRDHRGPRSPVARPLVALGIVAYGLYLWSGPLLTRWVSARGSGRPS